MNLKNNSRFLIIVVIIAFLVTTGGASAFVGQSSELETNSENVSNIEKIDVDSGDFESNQQYSVTQLTYGEIKELVYSELDKLPVSAKANAVLYATNVFEELEENEGAIDEMPVSELQSILNYMLPVSGNLRMGFISAGNTPGCFTSKGLIPHWTFFGCILLWKITLYSGGHLSINEQSYSGPRSFPMLLFVGFGSCNPNTATINSISGIGFGIYVGN